MSRRQRTRHSAPARTQERPRWNRQSVALHTQPGAAVHAGSPTQPGASGYAGSSADSAATGHAGSPTQPRSSVRASLAPHPGAPVHNGPSIESGPSIRADPSIHAGPMHDTWGEVPLDGLPKVARLQPIRSPGGHGCFSACWRAELQPFTSGCRALTRIRCRRK